MVKDHKIKCHSIIHGASAAAAATGGATAQVPLSDTIIIAGIQTAMVIALGSVFNIEVSESMAKAALGSAAAGTIGRGISQVFVGWMPFVGNAANATTAAALTQAIGWNAAKNFAKESGTVMEINTEIEICNNIYVSQKFIDGKFIFEIPDTNIKSSGIDMDLTYNNFIVALNKFKEQKLLSSDKSKMEIQLELLKKIDIIEKGDGELCDYIYKIVEDSNDISANNKSVSNEPEIDNIKSNEISKRNIFKDASRNVSKLKSSIIESNSVNKEKSLETASKIIGIGNNLKVGFAEKKLLKNEIFVKQFWCDKTNYSYIINDLDIIVNNTDEATAYSDLLSRIDELYSKKGLSNKASMRKDQMKFINLLEKLKNYNINYEDLFLIVKVEKFNDLPKNVRKILKEKKLVAK